MAINPNQIASNQSTGQPTWQDMTGPNGRPRIDITKNRNPQQVVAPPANLGWSLEYLSDRPKYYMRFDLFEYSRANLISVGNLSASGISGGNPILFPLPQQMVNVHDQTWTETPLAAAGAVLQGAADIFANPGAAASAALNIVNQGTNSLRQNQQGAAAAIAAGGNILAGGGTITGVSQNTFGAAQALLGFSPNQFVTLLYTGPEYKRHQFIWIFSPRDKGESTRLRDIITVLNNAMAPKYGLGGLVWGYPNIFKISYNDNSGWLYKFKPCVLKTFQANYTPSGRPAFYKGEGSGDNPPEAIQLSMQFIELEFWMQGDFNTDNNPSNVYGAGQSTANISLLPSNNPFAPPAPSTPPAGS